MAVQVSGFSEVHLGSAIYTMEILEVNGTNYAYVFTGWINTPPPAQGPQFNVYSMVEDANGHLEFTKVQTVLGDELGLVNSMRLEGDQFLYQDGVSVVLPDGTIRWIFPSGNRDAPGALGDQHINVIDINPTTGHITSVRNQDVADPAGSFNNHAPQSMQAFVNPDGTTTIIYGSGDNAHNFFNTFGGSVDVFTAKLDASGNLIPGSITNIEDSISGGTGFNLLNSVQVEFGTGERYYYAAAGNETNRIMRIKVDEDGNIDGDVDLIDMPGAPTDGGIDTFTANGKHYIVTNNFNGSGMRGTPNSVTTHVYEVNPDGSLTLQNTPTALSTTDRFSELSDIETYTVGDETYFLYSTNIGFVVTKYNHITKEVEMVDEHYNLANGNNSEFLIINGNLYVISGGTDFNAAGLTSTGSMPVETGIHAYLISSGLSVPCFTEGTKIKTRTGDCLIEDLNIGDFIQTTEGEYKELLWIGRTRVTPDQQNANPKLRPVRITAGALGNGLPKRDLLVSRQHRMLVRSHLAERMFGRSDVLIAAIKLTVLPGIFTEPQSQSFDYFHLLFENHEVIFAEGTPAESLLTGPEALKAIGKEARAEILSLFPEQSEAATPPRPAYYIPEGRQQKQFVSRLSENPLSWA